MQDTTKRLSVLIAAVYQYPVPGEGASIPNLTGMPIVTFRVEIVDSVTFRVSGRKNLAL